MRIDLGNDQWVEMRDPESITNRDRDQFNSETIPDTADALARERKVSVADVGEAAISSRVMRVVLAQSITGWSFPLPLPSQNPDVFLDDAFPYEHYNTLLSSCGPLLEALRGKTFAPAPAGSDAAAERMGPTTTSDDSPQP